MKIVGTRFGVAPLTARVTAAPGIDGLLTLVKTRTDDVLADVQAPVSGGRTPAHGLRSGIQGMQLAWLMERHLPGVFDADATADEVDEALRRDDAWRQ